MRDEHRSGGDSPPEADLLPDDVLEITFQPVRQTDDEDAQATVSHCPLCNEHVPVRANGTCPLGHDVP